MSRISTSGKVIAAAVAVLVVVSVFGLIMGITQQIRIDDKKRSDQLNENRHHLVHDLGFPEDSIVVLNSSSAAVMFDACLLGIMFEDNQALVYHGDRTSFEVYDGRLIGEFDGTPVRDLTYQELRARADELGYGACVRIT